MQPKKLSKSDLILLLAEQKGISKKEAKSCVDDVFSLIVDQLAAGNDVVTDFGILKTQDRAERQGRNPQTGEAITINASKTVKLTASKSVLDKLNQAEPQAINQ